MEYRYKIKYIEDGQKHYRCTKWYNSAKEAYVEASKISEGKDECSIAVESR